MARVDRPDPIIAPGGPVFASYQPSAQQKKALKDGVLRVANNARTAPKPPAHQEWSRDKQWQKPPSARTQGTERRGPDEDLGRRMEEDNHRGRPEGGTQNGQSHFDSDWAGRAILERWLRGGGDWNIKDDPSWSAYMKTNSHLQQQLRPKAEAVARKALNEYLAGNGASGTFSQRFHAEIENGEGIVGYQYLHGTNSQKGDFRFDGTTGVKQLPNGNYEVTIHGQYTWNDRIDANEKYATDIWKSRAGQVISLGQAADYDIHITWHADTTVVLDRSGHVLSMNGYPVR